jgi:hypothetical protein
MTVWMKACTHRGRVPATIITVFPKACQFRAGIPNVANNLNRKGHTERKESLVCLLLCCGFVFYALYVVEAALHTVRLFVSLDGQACAGPLQGAKTAHAV